MWLQMAYHHFAPSPRPDTTAVLPYNIKLAQSRFGKVMFQLTDESAPLSNA